MFSMNRSKGWSYFGITFSLTLILLGCAGKKPPIWGDAENGFILSYRPGTSDIYVYQRTRESTNTMERSGQSFETTSSSKFIFQLETEKIDSLISFVLTVDTIGYSYESSRGTQAMDFGDIKGKKVRATITPKGARHDIVPIDSLPIPKLDGRSMGTDAKGWLSIRLFQVPGKPIKIGDSWTEAKLDTNTHDDTTRQSTRTFINDSQAKYTNLGEEEKMGLACLHIQVDTEYSTQSWGSMRGTDISSEGEGETSSHAWFAYKEGILVEYNSDTFYEGTTAFSGQMKMTSPNSNESKSSLKLVRWIPAKR